MFDSPPTPDTAIATTAKRLAALCTQLANAYRRHPKIPVLETVLIQATETGTTFTTTDLDIRIRVEADDLTAAEPWQACVPFALLRRMASSLSGPLQISFTPTPDPKTTPDRLTITSEDGISATINLHCPATDFPALPEGLDDPKDWHFLSLGAADLRRLIDLAAPCISTEETRYYLNGIYFCRKPEGTTLRSVATDGHRMAVIDCATPAPEGLGVIVPTIAIRAMARLIDRRSNHLVALMFHRAGRYMRVVSDTLRIDCKLIDGAFPDYTRVIPKEETRTIVTVTQAALRCLAPYRTDRSAGVAFRDGRMHMRDQQLGEISAPAPALHFPSDSSKPVTEIGFNLRYLQAAAAMSGGTMRMELTGFGDPARIRGSDPDAMWILMPMRV